MRTTLTYAVLTAACCLPLAAGKTPCPARLKADVESWLRSARATPCPIPTIQARDRRCPSLVRPRVDKIGTGCGKLHHDLDDRARVHKRADAKARASSTCWRSAGSRSQSCHHRTGAYRQPSYRVMNSTSDAPGANDDASGVALVIEAARLLSKKKFDATIVYAALSGEEQGLLGCSMLAETAKEAAGGECGAQQRHRRQHRRPERHPRRGPGPRVFGRDPRVGDVAGATGAARQRRRGRRPQRALAKAIDQVARDLPGSIDVFVDRATIASDAAAITSRSSARYPAVRFSVGIENLIRDQDLRAENGIEYGDTVDKMDFAYLAR